jgi:hypothetical protein
MIEDGARRGNLRDSSGVWKTAPCKSHYSGNQAGSDPWGPIIVTPTVNMDGQIDFAAGADLVTVSYDLTHDWYPDYEVVIYVDGNQIFVDPDYAPPEYTPWSLIYSANKPQSGSFSFPAKTSKCCGGTCKD